MRRLSGNLFFCHVAFLNYCELFFFNGQTFIILGEGRGYYDMGHVLLLFTHESHFFSTYSIDRKMCRN